MLEVITKSEKITEGLRKSFQCTECKMANRVCYGYNTQSDGELIINELEAKVVRWIFDRYLAGDSFGKITAGLEKQGISSPTGKAKWNREAISKLLSNEKYTGSVLLQKTLSFCGMQFKNDGELRQVLIKNHHESIISVQDFERVQQIKNERAKAPAQVVSINLSF
ncbi:MAG TPA: recombinase family protein [Anaerovoracaceae bacterium]|nr:recombinase family protein [Anaerovoracaceae bacterium]